MNIIEPSKRMASCQRTLGANKMEGGGGGGTLQYMHMQFLIYIHVIPLACKS